MSSVPKRMESRSEITSQNRERPERGSSEFSAASDDEPSLVDGKQRTLLSVIVPVFKEEGNIDEFLRRIIPILDNITPTFEIIFTLDPSPDRTEEKILG
ncbi:MAG: glycosyltransferase, partial [Chthoniobacterales bacterium]